MNKVLASLLCAALSGAAAVSAWAAPTCTSSGSLKVCVAAANIRTNRALSRGRQMIAAAVELQVTNEASTDVSLSVSGSPTLMIGGVALSSSRGRGLVGIKEGDEGKRFTTFPTGQAQGVVFTFDQTLNESAVAAVAREKAGRLSVMVNRADGNGKQVVSISIPDIPIRNEVRPE